MSQIENIIQKVLSGNASKAEQNLLNVWIAKSEKNKQLFEEQQLLWQFMGAARKKINTDKVDVDAAWMRFQTLKEEKQSRKATPWMRIAAIFIVVLLAGGASTFYLLTDSSDPVVHTAKVKTPPAITTDSTQLVVAEVDPKEHTVKYQVRSKKQMEEEGFKIQILPDSSVVTLSPGSVLKALEYSPEHRVVSLAGAGFFNLKPTDQDFVIETKELVIRVEGTKFNVKTETESYKFIELLVEEGSMEAYEIANPANRVVLTSNESYLYDVEKHLFIKVGVLEKENPSRWKRFVDKISKPFRKKNKKANEDGSNPEE